MKEAEKLLKLRKEIKKRRPNFKAYESWRYKRVKSRWRKAQGIDSNVRKKKKGVIKSPNIGYRGPKKVRGLHPTGLEEVLIQNIADLENINRKKQIIKIASTIGAKKRRIILDLADEKRILVSNPGKIMMEEKILFPTVLEELQEGVEETSELEELDDEEVLDDEG